MRMEAVLDQEIKKVCPIDGMAFKDLNDKTTWRIDFAKEATPEQMAAAEKVVAEFVWDDAKQEEIRKQERDEEYKNDMSCRFCFLMYQEKNPAASFRDFMDYLEKLDVL